MDDDPEDMMDLYDDNDVHDVDVPISVPSASASTSTSTKQEEEHEKVIEDGGGGEGDDIAQQNKTPNHKDDDNSSLGKLQEVTQLPVGSDGHIPVATLSPTIAAPAPATKESVATSRSTTTTVSTSTPVNTVSSSTRTYSHPTKQTLSNSNNNNNSEIEALNDEIATLLLTNKITLTTSSKLQTMLRENMSLKEKTAKLKALLTRSAKASKETKFELEKASREVSRLNQRVESLADRPTHMDLLADFETNFDRALMSLHSGNNDENGSASVGLQQQSGEDTRPTTNQHYPNHNMDDQENVSTLLLKEISQAKSRIEHLESLNSDLMKRSSQFNKQSEQHLSQLERQNLKMSNLQLELRMAKMETENATREMRAKAASLKEMQMEIDLVTRSAMDANVRAAEGMEVAKSIKSDQAQVEELKAKVAALQEWAVAAAEAKEAILEENKVLEKRLYQLENNDDNDDGGIRMGNHTSLSNNKTVTLKSDNISPSSKRGKVTERKLWTKSSSLVIGAGTFECRTIELGENQVMDFETIILRWKFDITPSDLDIVFSMLKGSFDRRDKNGIRHANALIRDRHVVGGGGGEVQGAFVVQNACTLVFSNENSWVRPRTIKFMVDAFAVM